jgi:hypothetical protein
VPGRFLYEEEAGMRGVVVRDAAEAGVVLVYVEALPGAMIHGYVFFVGGIPVIGGGGP